MIKMLSDQGLLIQPDSMERTPSYHALEIGDQKTIDTLIDVHKELNFVHLEEHKLLIDQYIPNAKEVYAFRSAVFSE